MGCCNFEWRTNYIDAMMNYTIFEGTAHILGWMEECRAREQSEEEKCVIG
jgi:hypothetical protein